MPGGDRTGPTGMGPMTGRGAGYCSGYPNPGYAGFAFGRGFGAGFGGGRGRRNRFYATGLTGWQRTAYGYPVYGGGMPYNAPYFQGTSAQYTAGLPKEGELNALKGQAEYLEDSLENIKKRIEELETGKEE